MYKRRAILMWFVGIMTAAYIGYSAYFLLNPLPQCPNDMTGIDPTSCIIGADLTLAGVFILGIAWLGIITIPCIMLLAGFGRKPKAAATK